MLGRTIEWIFQWLRRVARARLTTGLRQIGARDNRPRPWRVNERVEKVATDIPQCSKGSTTFDPDQNLYRPRAPAAVL